MAYKTCDWCGRSYKPMFSADCDAGNAFADAMGFTRRLRIQSSYLAGFLHITKGF